MPIKLDENIYEGTSVTSFQGKRTDLQRPQKPNTQKVATSSEELLDQALKIPYNNGKNTTHLNYKKNLPAFESNIWIIERQEKQLSLKTNLSEMDPGLPIDFKTTNNKLKLNTGINGHDNSFFITITNEQLAQLNNGSGKETISNLITAFDLVPYLAKLSSDVLPSERYPRINISLDNNTVDIQLLLSKDRPTINCKITNGQLILDSGRIYQSFTFKKDIGFTEQDKTLFKNMFFSR